MELLLDIFGFASVILSGLIRAAQAIAIGSIFFLIVIAGRHLTAVGAARVRRIAGFAYGALILLILSDLGLHVAILTGTLDGDFALAIGDHFTFIQTVRLALAAIALLCLYIQPRGSAFALLALACGDLAAGIAISHAAARLDSEVWLFAATFLHHMGAALWIGGLPAFLYLLGAEGKAGNTEAVAHNYSRFAAFAVALILVSGCLFLFFYVGSLPALYGTAYGLMLATKSVLFLTILGLGAANFLALRRLAAGKAALPATFLRLRRFVEVELGIGLTVLFVAAAMTSLPPAIDLTQDRASLAEITERLQPQWPSLVSPDRDSLAINQLEKALAEARSKPATQRLTAYVPGSGTPLPRNAEDIAWSEYNHHWSGIIVLAVGLLALIERFKLGLLSRLASHWPLLFIALAIFLFRRSEAEAWPFGPLSLGESLRDPEFVQHKAFMALILAFAFFEWSQRKGYLARPWARYVLPLLAALGGAMLLTHSHSLANVKELLLIEMTHMPLAVFGIWAGWARWLELRLAAGPMQRFCGWLWPIAFAMVGLLLIFYREI